MQHEPVSLRVYSFSAEVGPIVFDGEAIGGGPVGQCPTSLKQPRQPAATSKGVAGTISIALEHHPVGPSSFRLTFPARRPATSLLFSASYWNLVSKTHYP